MFAGFIDVLRTYVPHKRRPAPIAQRFNAEIVKILKMPDVMTKLTCQPGMDIVGNSPDELTAFMKTDINRWADVVRKSGATAS